MTKIRDLVNILSAQPKPILCLDTCDLLDTIRGVRLRNLSSLRSFISVRDKLDLNTDFCQVVVSYLVKHEWRQNLSKVRIDETADLQKTAERHQSINEARSLIGLSRIGFEKIEEAFMIDGFVDVTRRIIDRAVVLERDGACIDRALGRLMDQQRPSHKNQIKDSIHLEHYLDLARQLKALNYGKSCLFVSGNKADFWAESGKPRIHPDLESDLQAAGLTFFARLEEAVRRLGI